MNEVNQANLNAAGELYAGNKIYATSMEEQAAFLLRPSTRYKPKIYPDGNMYCALLGDNLQEGVCGFGPSPDLAYFDFDKNWYKKL